MVAGSWSRSLCELGRRPVGAVPRVFLAGGVVPGLFLGLRLLAFLVFCLKLPGAFPLAEVLAADEVFTSSSVREILPVVDLDGRRFELGAAAAVLQQALRERAAKV